MFCEKCGKQIPEGAAFCDECGAAVKKEVKWFEGENKIIIILIAIFCGSIGLHNFAMGENKKAIVRIVGTLLCGVVGTILAWIDIVKMANGTYKVDPEAFI